MNILAYAPLRACGYLVLMGPVTLPYPNRPQSGTRWCHLPVSLSRLESCTSSLGSPTGRAAAQSSMTLCVPPPHLSLVHSATGRAVLCGLVSSPSSQPIFLRSQQLWE